MIRRDSQGRKTRRRTARGKRCEDGNGTASSAKSPTDIDMDVVNACEALRDRAERRGRGDCTRRRKPALQSAARMRRMESGPRGLRMPGAAAAAAAAGGSARLWRHGDGAWGFRAAITPNGLKNCSKTEWLKSADTVSAEYETRVALPIDRGDADACAGGCKRKSADEDGKNPHCRRRH